MDDLIDKMAEDLGVPLRTRLKWRQRGVPYRRREQIRDLALERGLYITTEEFDSFRRVTSEQETGP